MVTIIPDNEYLFADTFKRGYLLNDYRYAQQHKNEGYTKVSSHLGRQKTQTKDWMSGKITPKVVKSIDRARELELFPLHSDNKNFKLMNTLATWIIFSGLRQEAARSSVSRGL